jgi:psiF repeat-containing protein
MFKKLMLVAAMGGLLCAQIALANAADKTAQQEKMTACNKEAGDKQLKGDERKKFMSECLKGDAKSEAEAKPATQQDKMKICNKEAGDKKLKGDERKKFMSECLKGDANAGAETKAGSQPAKEAAPQKK